jgi:hypothetical protein
MHVTSLSSLLPSSTESPVKLDHAQQLVETNLRQSELRLEQISIRVEGIELRRHSALRTQVSQALPILQRCDQHLLLEPAFAHSLKSR